MADKRILGKTYDFEWEVERGKIAEFMAAVGDDSPVYRDVEAAAREGYSDIIAPPTFTTVPIMWSGLLFQAFEDLSIPLSRIMHAEQSYEFRGEIHPGDRLHGTVEIKSITERQGRSGPMDFVLFETTITNQHRRTVVREQMLVVERKQ